MYRRSESAALVTADSARTNYHCETFGILRDQSMSTLIATLATLTASMTAGCDAAAERPLFECDATLELVLELPMKTLIRRAERRPEVDGKLRYRDV